MKFIKCTANPVLAQFTSAYEATDLNISAVRNAIEAVRTLQRRMPDTGCNQECAAENEAALIQMMVAAEELDFSVVDLLNACKQACRNRNAVSGLFASKIIKNNLLCCAHVFDVIQSLRRQKKALLEAQTGPNGAIEKLFETSKVASKFVPVEGQTDLTTSLMRTYEAGKNPLR